MYRSELIAFIHSSTTYRALPITCRCTYSTQHSSTCASAPAALTEKVVSQLWPAQAPPSLRTPWVEVWTPQTPSTHTRAHKVTRLEASLRTDDSPQPKEAQPRSHALTSDEFNIWTPRLRVWSGGGFNWLFPSSLNTPRTRESTLSQHHLHHVDESTPTAPHCL